MKNLKFSRGDIIFYEESEPNGKERYYLIIEAVPDVKTGYYRAIDLVYGGLAGFWETSAVEREGIKVA